MSESGDSIVPINLLQAEAPVIIKSTDHSVELSWGAPMLSTYTGGRPMFHIKEEGSGIVYKGYATNHTFTGLSALAKYTYSVRVQCDFDVGPWSSAVTVMTRRQPRTCENLHRAINRGDLEMVKTILEESPHYIDVPDLYGSSPLMSACCQNKNDIVAFLIEKGANMEYGNCSGKTSLMEACYYGNTEGAMLVVGGGASWTTRDNSGFSALHYGIDGGHIPTINYILSEGVEVDDVDDSTLSQWTPLLRIASFGGNVQAAQILIEAGANINRKDKDGKTPLMLATVNGSKELVELFLAHGADPLTKSEFGKTAKDFAESFHHHDILKLLEPKGK